MRVDAWVCPNAACVDANGNGDGFELRNRATLALGHVSPFVNGNGSLDGVVSFDDPPPAGGWEEVLNPDSENVHCKDPAGDIVGGAATQVGSADSGSVNWRTSAGVPEFNTPQLSVQVYCGVRQFHPEVDTFVSEQICGWLYDMQECATFNGVTNSWTGPPNANGLGGGNDASNVKQCQGGLFPVTCSSGDFWHTFTDVAIPGRGGGLTVTRTYNSLTAGSSGLFGAGWSCSFCVSLAVTGSGATVTLANGAPVGFQIDATSGGFDSADGEYATLIHNMDGTYTFTVRGRQIYTFDANGRLTQTANVVGGQVTYSYAGGTGQVTSLTDHSGRSVTLGYGSNGLVSTVTDPLGRVTTYAYDAAAELTSATDPSNRVVAVTYDTAHRMLTMSTPAGGVVRNTFDSTGRVLTQTDPAGRVTAYAYTGDWTSPTGGTTTITQPAGDVEVESYTNGALVSLTKGYGTADPSTWTYVIDPVTLETVGVTDPVGYTSYQTYDSVGDVVSTTDADLNTRSWTYDLMGDALTSTDGAGVITKATYNAYGRLTSTSVPLGTGTAQTTLTYGDPANPGDLTASTDADGSVTHFGYDEYGDLTSVTDPDGDTTTATYDADGEKLSSTTAKGNVAGCACGAANTTSYTYAANGLETSVTDPLGGVTRFGYDLNGNLTSTTDPTGVAASYSYDPDNELVSSSPPGAATVTYGYDSDGRQVSVAEGTQPATTTTYDALGDALTSTSPTGALTTDSYNLDGRLSESTSPNGGTSYVGYTGAGLLNYSETARGGETSYGYDHDGRLTQVYDPVGNATKYTYDNLGRNTTTTQLNGATVTDAFDAAGRLTSYTDGASNVTGYAYTAGGRLATRTDPDGRVTHYTYDPDGNAATQTDPLSRVTTNTYDPDDRLTKTTYSATSTPTVSYVYDAAGRRLSMVDGTGTTTSSYDSSGRLTSVKAPTGTVGYSYDSLGQVSGITYPDGHVVTQAYDAADRLTSTTDWSGKTIGYGYDGDDNLATTTYPNGDTDTATYDAADQLAGITLAGPTSTLASFGYTLDDAGRLKASTDSLTPTLSTSYGYSWYSQLTTVASAASAFTYDTAGNLTGLSDGTTQTYDQAGQLKVRTPKTGPATTYAFDAAGDRTTQTAAGAPAPGTITNDVNITADNSTGTGTGAVTTAAFSTKTAGELLVALVAAGPATSARTVTVTGAGLTWSRVENVHAQGGDAEIWKATAASKLASQKVTATPTAGGGKITLEVLSYTGSSGTGAKVTSSAATGVPKVTLKTTGGNSVTVAVGDAGTANTAAVVASGQALLHQLSTTTTKGTAWTQRTTAVTATSGTSVTLADTAPTKSAWNEAGVEILASPVSGTPTTTSYAYNQAQQLTTYTPGSPAATTYTYNGDGLRATAATSGVTASYTWDTLGGIPLLLSDQINDYIYGPSGNLVEQVNKTTGVTYYLHTDRVGSVRVVSDSTGAVVGTTSYDPYGKLISRTGTTVSPFGFAGEYSDSSGLIYLRARYYDPTTGSFLTVDPLVDITGSAYGYVNGNPLNGTDPSGLISACVFGHNPDQSCRGGDEYNDAVGFLDPVSWTLPAYSNEIDAYKSGCGYLDSVGVGLEGPATIAVFIASDGAGGLALNATLSLVKEYGGEVVVGAVRSFRTKVQGTLAKALAGLADRGSKSTASASVRKFSEYLFKDGASGGKDAVFRAFGYSGADSQELAAEYEAQAAGKYASGDYTLGRKDQYGQRININITLTGQGAAAGRSTQIVSGWMIQADGSITLNTPFAGFADGG